LRNARSNADLFTDRFDAWCTHLEATKTGVTPYQYQRVILQLRDFYQDVDMWKLGLGELETFTVRLRTRAQRKPSLWTMRREQVVLRSFFTFCSKRFKAPNPAEGLEVIALPAGLPKPIPAAWIDRAIRAERNITNRLILELGADAGLRREGIRTLDWSDVDLGDAWGSVEVVEKGNRERSIPITGRLLKDLRRHRGASQTTQDEEGVGHSYVLARRDGRPLNRDDITQRAVQAFIRVGYEGATVHRLRHSFVTALFQSGVDARTVQELAGHASLETTQRYAEVAKKAKKDAIHILNGRA